MKNKFIVAARYLLLLGFAVLLLLALASCGSSAPASTPELTVQIRAWWQEVDDNLAQLESPFFFLPGNHDHYSEATIKVNEHYPRRY